MKRFDKKSLFLAGGMISAVLAVPTAFFLTYEPLKIDDRPTTITSKEVRTLHVNLDDRIRQIACKSRKKGIADLRNMVTDSGYEEQLVFNPDKDWWIEVGYGSRLVGKYVNNQPAVEVDVNTVCTLMAHTRELEIYHTHPFHVYSRKDRVKGVSKAQLEQYQQSHLARPSPRDLANMAHHTVLMKRHLKDNKLKECLASYYGLTCYSLTEEGVDHFKEIEYKDFREKEYEEILEEMESQKVPKFSRADGVTPEVIKKMPKDPIESARQYAKDVETEYVSVEFTPYKEILGDD